MDPWRPRDAAVRFGGAERSVARSRVFIPKGTRPGLAAGIPSGKLAMTIDGSQVRGLHSLRIGDRFDLLASDPLDLKGLQPKVGWKN